MKILKLTDQYEYEVALFMHKYINNMLPSSFNEIYKFNHEIQDYHRTRQSSQLNILRCDSEFARKLPLYNYPVVWNKWSEFLPSKDQYKTLTVVKKIIKTTILDKYVDNVVCKNPFCKQCFK